MGEFGIQQENEQKINIAKLKKKNALNIKILTKIYEDGNVVAVDDVSFCVKKGEIFSLLGPNGAGKTTLISIAATAMNLTSGSVEIFGYNIQTEYKKIRKLIGICPQDLVFYGGLTVYE
ncbi:MAG: ATP-binding cassette domain-containing protein, partial [Candidatus Lokiarchaeota archaeon]|nr:ATP-binding cassette domain-containing protein [Candidatus Lokiarchaeota archaeon]